MEPITREEMYLAKAGGQNVSVPTPVTRKEMFLNAIAGAVLPVVELSTVATEDGSDLTAEESAKMDEVAATGMPIVAKVPLDDEGTIFAIVMQNMMGMQYIAIFNGFQIGIFNTGSGWRVGQIPMG